MLVTIAICTWNRATLLDRTLSGMEELLVPDGTEFEVVVVNNCSTDGTDSVLATFQRRLPLVRVFESRLGHTYARNAAMEQARGELILWTDDDVLVARDWLLEYIRAAESECDVSFFGGPIEPDFEVEPPMWLRDVWEEVSGLYAIRELGDEPFWFNNERVPFGANFAIRGDIQRAHRYDTRLGRRGNDLGAADETTLLRTLLAEGHRGLWVPAARVKHFIPKERLGRQYLQENFFHQGRVATIKQRDEGRRLRMKDIVRIALRAIRSEVKWRLKSPNDRPKEWIGALRHSSFLWGRLSGLIARST